MKENFRSLLLECLKDAGTLIADAIDKEKKIDHKGRLSLVTETDKQAEELIIRKILSAFPEHGILAEESGVRSQKAKNIHRWIIDPLDGTTNFAHSFPMVCVSIALEENGTVVLGGVYDPIHGELFFSEKGKGATLNGKPISVSKISALSEALVCTGYPYDLHEEGRGDYYLAFTGAVMRRSIGIRRTGSAALDLAYVACGRLDAHWEWFLKPWDVAAGRLLVEEAGGQVTDFNGNAHQLEGSQTLASNGKIHAEMVEILSQCLRNMEVSADMKSNKTPGLKKVSSPPKVRKTWKINPRTRIKESDKVFDRTQEKASEHRAIDEIIDFFGEEEE